MKEKIIEMFDRLCLPFGEEGDFQKEKILMELTEASYIKGIGCYLPSKGTTKKIIVSHMDLVRPFQKGFTENRKFEIKADLLVGALDNTLTNAILVLAIQECGNEDTAYLFTEGEETGLTGMRNFMNTIYKDFKEKPFFVNLDVTNEFFNQKHISVEFDYPNFDICKQIFKLNPESGYTHIRFTDDTSAIINGGGNGFSFCIPTDKYCHTYDSNTRLSSLEPYYNGVVSLIKNVDFSNYVHDMKTLETKQIIVYSFKEDEEKKL